MDDTPPIVDLDTRSREIFRRIVEGYLDTGEPLGSRSISRNLPMTLSPASVRNVMTDLEEMGLIYAPHTSAGRLPTETGLRFFVDALLEVGNLSDDERRQIDGQVAGQASAPTVEALLTETVNMLSGLSLSAGVVMASKSDVRLKQIEFVRLENTRALVVLVSEDGRIENRIVDIPEDLPQSALVEAANYLNAHLRGRTLGEVRKEIEAAAAAQRTELDTLSQKVVKQGLAMWAGNPDGDDAPTLIVRGRSNLISGTEALDDLERIRRLFDDLETKGDLIKLLSASEYAEGVRIFIGQENKLFSLSGSSLIVSPYTDKDGSIVGVLGVIGPTRTNYARIIPMVDYTARAVSKLLSKETGGRTAG
ncbi:MAG: heat-inducible transcriptional repressor HrcA [Pseudomonadota bacterium]